MLPSLSMFSLLPVPQVASYTANLAAWLVLDAEVTEITGLDDQRLKNPVEGYKYGTVRGMKSVWNGQVTREWKNKKKNEQRGRRESESERNKIQYTRECQDLSGILKHSSFPILLCTVVQLFITHALLSLLSLRLERGTVLPNSGPYMLFLFSSLAFFLACCARSAGYTLIESVAYRGTCHTVWGGWGNRVKCSRDSLLGPFSLALSSLLSLSLSLCSSTAYEF